MPFKRSFDISLRKYVFSRRKIEKDLSAVLVVTEKVHNKWHKIPIFGRAVAFLNAFARNFGILSLLLLFVINFLAFLLNLKNKKDPLLLFTSCKITAWGKSTLYQCHHDNRKYKKTLAVITFFFKTRKTFQIGFQNLEDLTLSCIIFF